VLRRFICVMGRVVVVRGCLTMMLCGFRHLKIPSERSACATGSSPLNAKNARLLERNVPSVGRDWCTMGLNAFDEAKLVLQSAGHLTIAAQHAWHPRKQ